jgi:hypothetical protein
VRSRHCAWTISIGERGRIRVPRPKICTPPTDEVGAALVDYLRHARRRLDTFVNPLVYTFCGNQGPSIMTMWAALSE